GAKHVAHASGEEVVLRLESRVEAPVGESGTSHPLRHSDALCTLAPDRSGGFGEDAGACSLLVVVVVPHRFPEVFTTDASDNTTISQLWSACRYTLAHFAGDSTCIDMMDIIQPNAPWIVAGSLPMTRSRPESGRGWRSSPLPCSFRPSTRLCPTSPSPP